MGQIDTYDLPATSIPVGSTINFVKVWAWCGASRVGGKYRIITRTHSSNYAGSETTATDTNWHLISVTHNTNPNTGLEWTLAELNALEVGIELTSKRIGEFNYGTWCTQVYPEIDYTPPPAGGLPVALRQAVE